MIAMLWALFKPLIMPPGTSRLTGAVVPVGWRSRPYGLSVEPLRLEKLDWAS